MLARFDASSRSDHAPIVELFSDLACPIGLPDHKVVVVLEHDFYKPFDAIMAQRVQELARVRPTREHELLHLATLVEVAAIVEHADANVTAKVYSHLFESVLNR